MKLAEIADTTDPPNSERLYFDRAHPRKKFSTNNWDNPPRCDSAIPANDGRNDSTGYQIDFVVAPETDMVGGRDAASAQSKWHGQIARGWGSADNRFGRTRGIMIYRAIDSHIAIEDYAPVYLESHFFYNLNNLRLKNHIGHTPRPSVASYKGPCTARKAMSLLAVRSDHAPRSKAIPTYTPLARFLSHAATPNFV